MSELITALGKQRGLTTPEMTFPCSPIDSLRLVDALGEEKG